jgi:hypothetical protein
VGVAQSHHGTGEGDRGKDGQSHEPQGVQHESDADTYPYEQEREEHNHFGVSNTR